MLTKESISPYKEMEKRYLSEVTSTPDLEEYIISK
jgi:hypothetical protein